MHQHYQHFRPQDSAIEHLVTSFAFTSLICHSPVFFWALATQLIAGGVAASQSFDVANLI